MATILIVDDQPGNREYLVTLLAYAGHSLLEASHGAEALAIVRSQHPDLVVADLLMPVMDGYEFVRQLRADPAIAQTQVIYFTAAYLEEEAHRLAQAVGVQYILTKPAEPKVLLSMVAKALARPDATLGADVDRRDAKDFDREHIRLLTNKLAHKVDQLSFVNERLAALLELSQRLATKYDPADLLQTCCDAAREIIGARRAVVQIADDDEHAPLWTMTSDRGAGALAETAAAKFSAEPLAQRREDQAQASEQASQQHDSRLLSVPIASATQRYGVLHLIDKLGRAEFDAEDRRIAATLAAQTALAYENTQRFLALQTRTQQIEQEIAERTKAEQRLRLYTQRLETLHIIDRAIMAAHSPQAIAQASLAPIRQLIPSPHASIAGFDTATGEAEIWAAGDDWPSSLTPSVQFRLSELATIETLRLGQLFTVNDLRELAHPTPLQRRLLDEGIRGYVSVPIIIYDDLIGCLNIASDQPSALETDDIHIAREVAAQLALAIQNLKLFEQVRVGRERLQRLSQQLVQAQESERRRIARELHDEIGQSLTAAQLNLQVLIGISDLSELPDRLEDSLGLIDRVLQQVRTLSLDLRPSMLDDLGLVPTLRWYANRQAERAGFKVELAMENTAGRLPPDLETTCFRIAQEALNNIARYAHAKRVLIELRRQDSVLELTISDDGIGFDVGAALKRAALGQSLGLVSMQERAALVGGMIRFDSTPAKETTIEVRLPLSVSANDSRQIERRSVTR